jgi:uncharacterized protein (UPF0332 family)
MIDDNIKIINYKIEKSKSTLLDSKFLIDNKKYHIAANRIYYSVFYIISALAVKSNFETSKHNQLIGWFIKNFIATGKIEKIYGKIIVKLFDNRTKADYDDFSEFSEAQTLKMFEEAENMINVIIKFIENN